MSSVKLAVYDLSHGLASDFSQILLGKHIEAVWHTGIVAFGREFYFGFQDGIAHTPPGGTPSGTPVKVTRSIPRHILDLPKEALSSPAADILRQIIDDTPKPQKDESPDLFK